eukprot:CAMPEP_0206304000 /NCGR_PEP_ID=MMETSP0106_2-20121207/9523_1 /ASSEMBLY_ACC=CAM_ASM_000206 /TAXON_ID=81532 /ORGANISM="Acanthoeca-like sp., Strain 10tr" /LENGTH=1375 /DNA_ID=CAMNT_0053734805 /DNA_START=73 /DNA_END=4197 /DNA_ORIENTATION=-
MGIPKFYRWTSERYPCLSQTIVDAEVPEIDNLYLDMNGIIHNCSHPNDEDPNFRITEEIIFDGVMRYIEGLFRIIRPKRLFYMAVDGCAPRAKMNQQRARRFRSAKDAEAALEAAIKKGTVVEGDIDPETGKKREDRFDSNCITPGTPFMTRLQAHLEYFVHKKLSKDPTWKSVKVILDGHQCPGEGEHKILDYIRSLKTSDGYDPNTRHCMYGLDADLMILGLLSHEPYFFLLREEVTFGRSRGPAKKQLDGVEQKTWHLLSLTLYRDYLDAEFSSLANKLKFAYDFERLLDDWVLLSFFIGNDFLPHLPDFHIADDITPYIYGCYRETIVQCDGWLTDGGVINLARLQILIDCMAKFDRERFDTVYVDTRWAGFGAPGQGPAGRKTKKGAAVKPAGTKSGGGGGDAPALNPGAALLSMLKGGVGDQAQGAAAAAAPIKSDNADDRGGVYDGDADEDDSDDVFDLEFLQHKRGYYVEKFKLVDVSEEFIGDLARQYVEGLQWVLLYYFKGVPSWGWFFNAHYTPFVSDIHGIADLKLNFELGEPFLPFQQLMSVLPPASKKHVPEAMQPLMIDPKSPILDFYPLDFATDLNGKKQDWEALVLICFIDEKRLLDAMSEREHLLTKEEMGRNIRSTPIEMRYNNKHPVLYKSPSKVLPDVDASCVERAILDWPHCGPERKHMLLNEGVDMECYMVGYPTLRHVPFKAELKEARVTVFNRPSDKETLMLTLLPRPAADPAALGRKENAGGLIGKSVWVDWPHLREARVVAVSTSGHRFADKGATKYTSQMSAAFKQHANDTKHTLRFKRGIDIKDVTCMVHVRRLIGKRTAYSTRGKATVEKVWSPEEVAIPWQLIVDDINALQNEEVAVDLTSKFHPGVEVVKVSKQYRGCLGSVVSIDSETMQLHVQLQRHFRPRFKCNTKRGSADFVSFHEACRATGLSPSVCGRLICSIYVHEGTAKKPGSKKRDLGLKIKFKRREEEVMGFARRVGEKSWEVSHTAVGILKEYKSRFPKFITALSRQGDGADVYVGEFAPGDEGPALMKDIQDWLRMLPSHGAERVPCGTKYLDSRQIADLAQAQTTAPAGHVPEIIELQKVLAHEVHVLDGSKPPPAETSCALGDRVVYVNATTSVPCGSRGNIVSVIGRDKSDIEVLFDTVVPGGTDLNGRVPAGRGLRSSASWFVQVADSAPGDHGAAMPVAQAAPAPDVFGAPPPFFSKSGGVAVPLPRGLSGNGDGTMSEADQLLALLQSSVAAQPQPAPVGSSVMEAQPPVPAEALPLPTGIQSARSQVAYAEGKGENGGAPEVTPPPTFGVSAKDLGRHGIARQPKGPMRGRAGGFEQRRAPPPPAPKQGEPDLDEYATMWKHLLEINMATLKDG